MDEPARQGTSESTSISLLERVKAQDSVAWDRLVDLYGPLVYYWITRSGITGEEKADLFQEVFQAVVRGIPKFEHSSGGSFRGWLRVITTNKIRDHFRQRADQVRAAGGSDAQARFQEVSDPLAEPDEAGEAAQFTALLHRGLDLIRSEFSDRTWQAFWRTAVDGRTSTEAAEELGMTANSVRLAKARVLRRLRDELGGLLEI